jgi:hypothetical protein
MEILHDNEGRYTQDAKAEMKTGYHIYYCTREYSKACFIGI